LSAFSLETALPFAVRGPVDFRAFRRLASICFNDIFLGIRSGGRFDANFTNDRNWLSARRDAFSALGRRWPEAG